jgi:hypothetical protein
MGDELPALVAPGEVPGRPVAGSGVVRGVKRREAVEAGVERPLVGDIGVGDPVDAGVLDANAGVAPPLDRGGETPAAAIDLHDADRHDAVTIVGGGGLDVGHDEAHPRRQGGQGDLGAVEAHAAPRVQLVEAAPYPPATST